MSGERSEFHPLNAIAVTRKNGAQARAGEWETDAYIGSDGTFAHVTEECARHTEAAVGRHLRTRLLRLCGQCTQRG